MNFRDQLNNAVTQLYNHEDALAASLFKYSIELGAPSCLVELKAMTLNYMLLPLSNNLTDYTGNGYIFGSGAKSYFDNIVLLRNIAIKDPNFYNDYKEALISLINIKELFFRVAGIDYYTEIAKSTTGIFIENVYELFSVIHNYYEAIITKDALNIKHFLPGADINTLALDLLEVKSYCLNLLLSYTTVEHTNFIDKGYTATTYVNGPFADTTVRKNISTNSYATVCPRLHLLNGQKVHYQEYLNIFNATVAQINQYKQFNCNNELRNGIRNMIEHKVTNKTGKEYFAFVKKFEKKIKFYDGQTYRKFLFINFYIFISFFQKLFQTNPVCSFELDRVFTKKIIMGVCSMLASGKHWDVNLVRVVFSFLALCCGLGIGVYLILSVLIICEKYLFIYVEKHC